MGREGHQAGGIPTGVLLATDGSPDAALAARAAVDLAGRSEAQLHVVHVWHDVPSPHFRSYIKVELERQGREVLDEQVKRIEDAGGTVSGAHLRKGRAAEEIVGLAEKLRVGLIVLGSRGLGPVGRLIMGSVSEGVVHHARVPVLVMRGGAQYWPPSQVVVADDSFEDTEAEQLAARVAGLFGAEVSLVRFYQGLLADSRGGKDLLSRTVEDALHRPEEALSERVDEMEKALGKRPRTRAFVGDPAASLLQLSEEGERPVLLAVGGLGSQERVRIGSVPDKVMRAARGPFLFVPRQGMAKAREDGLLSSVEKERVEVGEHKAKVLVATDGSKASFHAAERAVHLARYLGAKLYVLYAIDKDRAFHAGIHYGEDLRELERAGKEAVDKVAALADEHGVECENLVVEGGRAAKTILWEAQVVGADYIVMGAEGMSRLESIMIGNVAQEVLRRADRTVLLVGGKRSPDDPMLSPRSSRQYPEVALDEGEALSEPSERQVVN